MPMVFGIKFIVTTRFISILQEKTLNQRRNQKSKIFWLQI